MKPGSGHSGRVSSPTTNFSKFSHLASLASPFAGNFGDFDCYKPSLTEAEDSAVDWCKIADMRHCLNLVSCRILHLLMQSWRNNIQSMKPGSGHNGRVSSPTMNFSKFSHLASSAGPFAGNFGDFNCYKPSLTEAEDSAIDWCKIADTRTA